MLEVQASEFNDEDVNDKVSSNDENASNNTLNSTSTRKNNHDIKNLE